ncbi:PREDICTED: renin receptor [Papilio polytes]|uniref:renin receptor n=1 Tax=Papilio polytes TaxID=76194 RepID=UPI0006764FE4|nr:PREDICTED: renin receptor [Papilio polytes]
MTVIRLHSRNMGVIMALFCLTLVLSILGANGAGEFSVLHSPESLKFSGTSEVEESLLKEIFSASFGLSVDQNSAWNGLSIVDPFNTPEAIVEVYVEGVSSLGSIVESKGRNYPLVVDEYEPDTFNVIKHRIEQRFSNGGNILTNIQLSNPGEFQSFSAVFGDMAPPKVPKQTLQHLKISVEEDYQFLAELEALKLFISKINAGAISPDNIIDFYNFRFRSLHVLSDLHGPNSLQTKEAKKLLGEELMELSKAFSKAYDGAVLVSVVCTDVAHTRRAVRHVRLPRQAPTPPTTTASPPSATAYSADYAAIFNILLWFGVIFTFTLVAIVYAIMDMDPGRDSIIYRMTSTRMKKDN